MRYSQHDDSPWDAGQLPSRVIFARGTGDLFFVRSHAPTPPFVRKVLKHYNPSSPSWMESLVRSPKELLGRDEDVQVLHGFSSEENAQACLGTNLFTDDVVGELKSLLEADLEVRIYSVA